jgi:hypothetical protein
MGSAVLLKEVVILILANSCTTILPTKKHVLPILMGSDFWELQIHYDFEVLGRV